MCSSDLDEMKQMFLYVAAGNVEPKEWEKWWNSNKATEKDPNDPRTGRPMWNLGAEGKPHPWRSDDYLFGVWNLLNGKETEGYVRLEECVRHNSDYMENRIKEFPEACNDPRDVMAVMYHNAQLFARTKEIADAEKRKNAIRETYEEVCRFMRYYHGLVKKTERNG